MSRSISAINQLVHLTKDRSALKTGFYLAVNRFLNYLLLNYLVLNSAILSILL